MQRLLKRFIRWLQRFVDTHEEMPSAQNLPVVSAISDIVEAPAVLGTGSDHDAQVETEHHASSSVPDIVDEVTADDAPRGFTRVISFLGAHKYNETAYYMEENPTQKIKTRYTGYAMHQLCNADETLFFCTDKAINNYNDLLKDHPAFSTQQRKIDIPDGTNTQQMWQIFQLLTDQILDDDVLIIDVSGSLRSLPIIVSASLQFLQEVRNIRIARVLYGAYDINASVETPIIDLKPFVDLNRWVNATHTFVHYAQGAELAQITHKMAASAQDPWRKIGQRLSALTSALQLVHLSDVSRLATELITLIDDLPANADISAEYLPNKMLLQKVAAEYQAFRQAETVHAELQRQQSIIRWYINHSLYAQAILLAHELLISVSIYREYRNGADTRMRAKLNDYDTRVAVNVDTVWGDMGKQIRLTRNNLAHALFRSGSVTSNVAKRKIVELCERVIALKI